MSAAHSPDGGGIIIIQGRRAGGVEQSNPPTVTPSQVITAIADLPTGDPVRAALQSAYDFAESSPPAEAA